MTRRILNALIAIALFAGPVDSLLAATCSCAGAPLLSSIETSAIEEGQLFINYTIENHQISDLVAGSKDINDETGRDRNSVSQVISASYAISDRWAVSALVSHVQHERLIATSLLGKTTSSGIGDSVVLLRYTPLFITPFSRHQVSLGLGARLSTGDSNAGEGFAFSEDMQPGTGALGKIAWASYSYAFDQASTVRFNVGVNFTTNDENDRHYRFGDDFNLAFGVSHSVGTRFGYSAAFRYRHADPDERLGFDMPNTGGEWLDFIPAIQYSLNDRLNIGLSGRIPVSRELKGALQFTTSYSYALSLTYGF